MKKFLAILIGKLIFFLSQNLKIGGGSALPGLLALKIYPQLIADLSQNIKQIVIITGTNGKTTTARLLAHFAQFHGLKIIRNATGSNLERGIASVLLANYRLLPAANYQFDLGIWELDEAAFNQVVPQLKPNVVIFLNVFRDQLDRYGEVDTVVKKWCQTLKTLDPSVAILINGDDHNLLQLKQSFNGKVQFFGVKDYKIEGEKVIHQTEKEALNYEAIDVNLKQLEQTKFKLGSQSITLPLAGIYNIYNFLAAFAAARLLDIPQNQIISSLSTFSPAFGRMEKFSFTPQEGKHKCEGFIFLVKNPAGATQVFQTINPQLKTKDHILFALNDNLADGTDVSWIWDANFEEFRNLSQTKSDNSKIFVSGKRAYDLALRLKYAGFNPKQLIVEPDMKRAFQKAQETLKGRLFILPTYTCMLELQKILSQLGIKKDYWRENQ